MTDINKDLLEGLSSVSRGRVVLSGILGDAEKVATLRKLTPASRSQILLQHGSMGVPWDQALEHAEYLDGSNPQEDPEPASGEAVDAVPDGHDRNPNRLVQRWRHDALKPNEFNARLFPDSLADDSIKVLAEQLLVDGRQRVPVEITPEGIILDGHRRWLAMAYLGWEMVDVVVVPGVSGDAVLDYVLGAYSSTRKPSLREQYLIFSATVERLKATVGSQQGEQTFGNPNVWAIERIRKVATEKAGLSSVDRALKLKKLFEEGTPEHQAAVVSGELSLSAVYESLPKREKASSKASEPSSDDITPEATETNDPDAEITSDVEVSSEQLVDVEQPSADDEEHEELHAEEALDHDVTIETESPEVIATAATAAPSTKENRTEALEALNALDVPLDETNLQSVLEHISEIIEPIRGNPFAEVTLESVLEAATRLYERSEDSEKQLARIRKALGLKRNGDILEAIEALGSAGPSEPDDVLSGVAGAIGGLRESTGYDETRERCEALVGEIWEALGEAPDEESFEEDDGLSFLER